jgi:hypothetical protein
MNIMYRQNPGWSRGGAGVSLGGAGESLAEGRGQKDGEYRGYSVS